MVKIREKKKPTIDIDSARKLMKLFGAKIINDFEIVYKELNKEDEQP